MVCMSDETPKSPFAKKTQSLQRGKAREAVDRTTADAGQRFRADLDLIADSPAAKAASESMKRFAAEVDAFAESPAAKAFASTVRQMGEMTDLAGIKQTGETIRRLTE